MKLLFASHNQGKVREVFDIFSNLDFELLSLNNFSHFSSSDVAETGKTFQENALLKAQYFATNTGLLTIGDDSGLVVDALDGFPGVLSNRWLEGSDINRNQGILNKMKGIEDKSASFQTALCLFDPVERIAKYFEGKVKGKIASEQKGEAGFGYDPIFVPNGYKQTFGQLGLEVKNKLSHRARALNLLNEYLKKMFKRL